MGHETIADAIEREILPALGEWAADYDVDAMARELFEYSPDTRRLEPTGADFWEVARRHDVSSGA